MGAGFRAGTTSQRATGASRTTRYAPKPPSMVCIAPVTIAASGLAK